VLHVHCYPERHPRGEPGTPPVVRVAQYICAADECNATWRMLPMFLARHLWRVWKTVERVALPGQPPPPTTRSVPERTRSRWRARLAAAARVLVVLFAASGGLALEEIAARVGLDASRAGLVVAYAELADVAPDAQLAAVAALAHRLERGIRLM
jgi:hypothetical protein